MRRSLLLAATGLLLASSCGSGDSAECVERGDAQVCAENSDGSIEFSGSGLQPDSAVVINNPEIGLSVYEVEDDGTFEPGNRDVRSFVDGTVLTFSISATDADGGLIEGDIDITL